MFKRNLIKAFMIVFSAAFLLTGCSLLEQSKDYAANAGTASVPISRPPAKEEPSIPEPEPEPDPLVVDMPEDISSEYVLLYSLEDALPLLERNSGERMYPASMTKIMTVILAMEHLPFDDREIYMEDAMYTYLYEANASQAGFLPGECVSVTDLLYGAMLPSGAECCMALAFTIAGSEEDYVDMMNAKARELGMVNTHFVNTSGLHDPMHYSTAEDMRILLEYALSNDSFRRLSTTGRHYSSATNLHPDGITLNSTLFTYLAMLEEEDYFAEEEPFIVGGKTGFTYEAGFCLASWAEIEGREYLLITAGAEGDPYEEPGHILDALAIYSSLAAALAEYGE